MNKYRKWQYQMLAKEMVGILNQKGYDAHYAENLDEAKGMVLRMIPPASSVALGGSETISEMELVDIFRNGEYHFFDRYQSLPFDEIVEIYRQSLLADFLVTGTNAVTRQGELVNVDSSGNRVAGMIFGPKRVIVIAGANKVVKNVDEALKRLKNIAPMNALRNGHKTPCTETGRCMECVTPERIDNVIGIINHGMKFEGRISVIMIAEETGF
ncbi:MAG: lactate utilization protein [Clostridia bacterium]|nr:lactate utilization protein [Clostridia bacterium]